MFEIWFQTTGYLVIDFIVVYVTRGKQHARIDEQHEITYQPIQNAATHHADDIAVIPRRLVEQVLPEVVCIHKGNQPVNRRAQTVTENWFIIYLWTEQYIIDEIIKIASNAVHTQFFGEMMTPYIRNQTGKIITECHLR